MEVLKKYKKQLIFHGVLNIIFLIFITLSTFIHIPFNGVKDRLYYFFLLLLIQLTVFGFLYFISLHRKIFLVLFPIIFITSGISAFWVYTQDIIINDGVIRATLETKPDVIRDLLSLEFVIYIFILFIILFFIQRLHKNTKTNSIKSPLTILAILALISFIIISQKKVSLVSNRLPYNLFYGLKEYYKTPRLEFKKISGSVISNRNESFNIILVIGESVRADHLYLNGYHRNTTPFLSKRNNIISFNHLYTNKTYTAVSIPQLLSNQSINNKKYFKFYSIIDVLNAAQISTCWIGNQTPEISYLPFIQKSNKKIFIDPFHSEFSFNKKLDGNMLSYLDGIFSPNQKQLIIFHMMGSHWYYENRYPKKFRKFKPVISSKYVNANQPQELINSYDNTILYTDFFLEKLIQKIEIKKSNTLLIYISDHGESLGEKGNWLHAQENEAIKNPALIFWFSKKFSEKNHDKINHLNSIKTQKITTDFLYHTLLGLYKIHRTEILPKEILIK